VEAANVGCSISHHSDFKFDGDNPVVAGANDSKGRNDFVLYVYCQPGFTGRGVIQIWKVMLE
jgi:hypothetical protein